MPLPGVEFCLRCGYSSRSTPGAGNMVAQTRKINSIVTTQNKQGVFEQKAAKETKTNLGDLNPQSEQPGKRRDVRQRRDFFLRSGFLTRND